MDWNDEAIARLRALWDEGHSTAEIGRRLGITKNAVVGKAHRLSLPARPSPIRRTPSDVRANVRAPRRPAPRRASDPMLAVVDSVSPAPPASGVPQTAPRFRPVPVAARPPGRMAACCWPVGEPGKPEFHFCSESAVAGKPYCAEHASIAYVKVRERREDAA